MDIDLIQRTGEKILTENKRKIEVVLAACAVCEDTIALKPTACEPPVLRFTICGRRMLLRRPRVPLSCEADRHSRRARSISLVTTTVVPARAVAVVAIVTIISPITVAVAVVIRTVSSIIVPIVSTVISFAPPVSAELTLFLLLVLSKRAAVSVVVPLFPLMLLKSLLLVLLVVFPS